MNDRRQNSDVRPRPRLLRALGDASPPVQVQIGGAAYERLRILKYDSWAVTALYRGPTDKMICKFNRCQPILGIPMGWLGRMLAGRERRALQRFSDLPRIPDDGGDVTVDQVRLAHACAHVFLEGHPLQSDEYVNDAFFLICSVRSSQCMTVATPTST